MLKRILYGSGAMGVLTAGYLLGSVSLSGAFAQTAPNCPGAVAGGTGRRGARRHRTTGSQRPGRVGRAGQSSQDYRGTGQRDGPWSIPRCDGQQDQARQ